MIENSELFDNIGKTYGRNILNDISKLYFEKKNKIFEPIENITNSMSIVSVLSQGEILAQGMSCVHDVLNNNWGKMLTGLLSDDEADYILQDITDVARTMRFSGQSAINFARTFGGAVLGSQAQIGQGSTPATRSDFNIETPFANGGLEDSLTNTGTGVWVEAQGHATVPIVINPTTGAGVISESVLVMSWIDKGVVVRKLLASRDNISPVVNFGAGATLTIDYIIALA